tara:strand:+ start:735 stop:1736 length:1002 start_codon:yes stop_codon:yes gene_type:complete
VSIGICASYCSCGAYDKTNIGYQANLCGRANQYTTNVGGKAGCCGWWIRCATNIGYYAGGQGGYGCTSVHIGDCANRMSYVSRCSVSIGLAAGYCSHYGTYNIMIGWKNSYWSGKCGWGTWCHNTMIGSYVNNGITSFPNKGKCNIIVGACSILANTGATCNINQIVIGTCVLSNGDNTTTLGTSSTTNSYLCGAVSKGSGSFRIVHPDPKKKNKWLFHSFVESPNAGDNIYRWSVNVCGCSCCFELPDYYKYLNENSMAWVKPVGHLGSAYATLNKEQDNLILCSNRDGCYNILLIGTRCDKCAVEGWPGLEEDFSEYEVKTYAGRKSAVIK